MTDSPCIHVVVDVGKDFVQKRFPERSSVNRICQLKGLREGLGVLGLGGIARLNTAGAVETFGVTIGVAIFLKEILQPAKDLVGLRNKSNFITVHEVKGIGVSDVGVNQGTGKLGITEAFVDGGADFEDQFKPEATGKDSIRRVER